MAFDPVRAWLRPASVDAGGFTLIELMVVVGIIAIMTAVTVPSLSTAASHAKLRSASSSLAGLLQSSRFRAVKSNRTMTVHFITRGGVPVAFAKDVTDTSADTVNTSAEAQLGGSAFRVAVPADGTPALTDTVLSFTPVNFPDLISFDPRGLPCKYTAGVCTTAGFAYYVTDTTQPHAWAAVSVSPGGRVKQWFWNGSAWAD